ncbi:hypothetical protein [Azoarcus sp. KH32C]|uniref:DUF6998 domain-containing protein n=1 Tax=Azoarcus sp. KH32C TaxID=748247 RepID=UPI00023865E0|nr:hypothetical protein [Azoarcus sp. KH32C]BAL23666.1 hypothetical protein AZKH_1344 [Azoarcus sp. KH32C]
MQKEQVVLQLPEVVNQLWTAQQALAKHYAQTQLKFTLDGRLVGDIAEALAFEYFDLVPPRKRTGGVDALTKSGKTVQVKASGLCNSGPAFTPGKGFSEYLLFFQIDFRVGRAKVLYNGPEAPIRALLPAEWKGTKVVPLQALHALAMKVAYSDALPFKGTQC